jgi:hypothetical protein
MNTDMGMEIGDMVDMVGEGVDVDVGDDGTAVGEYLRVKTQINITKPLMRGFMRPGKESDSQIWCPFEYEFLPEFCYICGIIGHDYDGCSITLAKGERRQYGGWLRAFIPKRSTHVEQQRWNEGRTWGYGRGSSPSGRGSGRGSDSLSWRKEELEKHANASRNKSPSCSEEATSPLKLGEKKQTSAAQKKLEFPEKNGEELSNEQVDKGEDRVEDSLALENKDVGEAEGLAIGMGTRAEEAVAMQGNASHVDPMGTLGVKKKEQHRGSFKRKQRKGAGTKENLNVRVGKKREVEDMEIEEEEMLTKKAKVAVVLNNDALAGLPEQPCKEQ